MKPPESEKDRHRILDVVGIRHLIDASNWDEAAVALAKFGLAMRDEERERCARIVHRGAPGELPDVYDALASRIRGRHG